MPGHQEHSRRIADSLVAALLPRLGGLVLLLGDGWLALAARRAITAPGADPASPGAVAACAVFYLLAMAGLALVIDGTWLLRRIAVPSRRVSG